MPGRRSLPWRNDPVILARLPEVERRHLKGEPNTGIAIVLKVDEITIRRDLERLRELWRERTIGEVVDLKAQALAELEDVRRRALAAAEHDERMERAVLFNEVFEWVDCPGGVDHSPYGEMETEEEGANVSLICAAPHRTPLRVKRDFKGSAQFRGNKSGALNVARQASMDKAKVQGIILDRQEHEGEILVRVYERGGPAALEAPDASTA